MYILNKEIHFINIIINRWVIKARCTQKSEIKYWANQRSEGKLFSVNLLDNTVSLYIKRQ